MKTKTAAIASLEPVPKREPGANRSSAAASAKPQPVSTNLGVERDAYSVTALSDIIDRSLHAAAARFTLGLSPAALTEAYLDWATHLTFSPGKQLQLIDKAARKALRFNSYLRCCATERGSSEACILPLPQDRRFAGPDWQRWPYNALHQAFLLQQQWWHNATTDIRGVTTQHENIVSFVARQLLDVISPSNWPLTNPEVLRFTRETRGANLIRGFHNFVEDWERAVSGKRPIGAERFVVGRDVAATPGKVVYRNRLIELIQYTPTTPQVHPEPVLIVPAWIMKYYILDLSPKNSLVKYLVDQGFTVFMISWRNPGPEDRDLGMEDYRTLGPMAAMDHISSVMPERQIHAVGYCLGGTLLSITAAAMGRDGDERLKSITLLASQTDFTEAGELMLFINESQLSFLEDMMWEQGFLDAKQMAGAFQILRSNDLIWSKVIHEYLMGERAPMTDLMAWNADATRMPYRMHSEYLRRLFFNNDLAEGRFRAGGQPVVLTDIRAPIFAVGTVWDHVAPWRSTYKIHLQTGNGITYLLTTGGHNAGIVSVIGRTDRSFQVLSSKHDEAYIDPDTYLMRAPRKEGSWWPQWASWLREHSGASALPPPLGVPGQNQDSLQDAPGAYVLQD
ncbi:PHA/PHB synthase family protein [Rhodoplanes sp. Z2-YC6860]|uniref:PHA/PHB synthase family protein n=1 Tax=Rhodoplanes sp. Z2-YC6860 TaxID=674703 RepID=UPI00078E0C84|nr:alpha/beta fold hydrolase [Rhodoplanes sp. Z2-YC6860]AMN38485.1 Poly-beta-hydroxybutyrate polymerase domain protein [Rhodoplanes sp. Z2-YC6860]